MLGSKLVGKPCVCRGETVSTAGDRRNSRGGDEPQIIAPPASVSSDCPQGTSQHTAQLG